MRRVITVLGVGLIVLVCGPAFFYGLFPEEPPALPSPDRLVEIRSDTRMHVVDRGAGPVSVLVHGAPGNALDWRELQAALTERGQRTIAIDRLGYGHSDPRLDAPHTPNSNAQDLLQLLEVEDLRDVTVVGWSYGGVTAIQAALTDPSRIGRLVLVGTAGPDSPDATPPEPNAVVGALYSTPMLLYRRAVPPLSRALQAALSDQAFSGGAQPDWWAHDLAANFASWKTTLTYRNEIFADVTPVPGEVPFEPSKVDLPTLILHGDDDRLAPIAIARYLDEIMPASELTEFPAGSHMLPITHAEEVADRVLEFLQVDPAPGPRSSEPT